MRTIIRNGSLLDTTSMTIVGERDVVIEDGVITAVEAPSAASADVVVDASGKFVTPGLLDAHVHFRLATMNFHILLNWSEVEYGITMARLSRETVERGFTTVRDLGGEVNGLMRAIAAGATLGPRIVRAGQMISQTGGHGDTVSGPMEVPPCACSLRSNEFSIVADGPDAVRKAARHILRDGSDFIKIHVSGGVASPADPLHATQFTPEEVAAVVTEARHRGTYVAAHAYTCEAIRMAVDNGVLSVEHANLIDADTAKHVAASGATIVPTLSTYKAMQELGPKLGLPPRNLEKNTVIFESGLRSVELASAAGVPLGFGTDLIGETQMRQNAELTLRAEVQPAVEVLRSMWQVNPRLMHLEGKVGVLSPGAFGDVVVSTANPLENLLAFADHTKSTTHVVQGGVVRVDRTA